jgi:hypothetical protein
LHLCRGDFAFNHQWMHCDPELGPRSAKPDQGPTERHER